VDEDGALTNSDGANIWPVTTGEFSGTFDGKDHTLSGVYHTTTTNRGGLFGVVGTSGCIQNLKLIDSYFISNHGADGAYGGEISSIAGNLKGTIQNVYSEAYVVADCSWAGGFVGRMQTKPGPTVKNCWYNGNLYVIDYDDQGGRGLYGGIVGDFEVDASEGYNTLTNCLFSGTIKMKEKGTATNEAFVGGIGGGGRNSTRPVKMTNCLSLGEISVTGNNVGALIGYVARGTVGTKTSVVTGCYATNEYCAKPFHTIDTDCTIEGNTYDATTYANGYYGMMVNKTAILGDLAKTNMPLLINETNTAWECVENGTPILSYFADWWLARQ
jgi:hypothetical protein